ncbi:MAG: betaine/proline/choline family ABC transporter ATP-binding protein [Tateyamaria sp.]|jgi:glycine betaine/proline transport system ATP-binding protein|nr:betaine/proline/choline family ABC transporter ATP-binding protein [Tateyamaria sp.]MCH9747647.1 betaine/proline/choline family ABC transporter ATP-binding protein [Alphaproteobacteria bacterium]MBT5301499.1 betaine/proline/choline family ABC transporter ATP-binding protein [Tateyamaria sp.]MBT6342711.1 betaine/proline/choline family ABC transporter ATP-binding protein [Tateyamaria sp.]MBT7446813.1 betaine/proline/choline family ABC transporter ATP-binding protein [Tateyamaria sp.]
MSKNSIENERPVISCLNVWKVFGANATDFEKEKLDNLNENTLTAKKWTAAVCDVSFDIGRGEVFVIMGLSGSGKSTMVRCMSRLIEPTSGDVNIEGENLLSVSDEKLIEIRRQKMGMVFQHFALLPNRDVLGNVAFPLQVQGISRKEREVRASEMISLVGLEGRENFFPAELSGGQQQRVGIARSLASNPSIWFLDEPFSALDPLIRSDLQDELLRLQAQLNKTIVFITHDLDEAIKIADRIAIMDQGRIVQIGTPEDLIMRPANEYVARFTKGVPKSKVVKVSTIMKPVAGNHAKTSSFLNINDRVADVADILTKTQEAIGVRNDGGDIVGVVDRETFIRILAGADIK